MQKKALAVVFFCSVVGHYIFVWLALFLSFLALDGIIPTRVLVAVGQGFAPVIALCVPHIIAAVFWATGMISMFLVIRGFFLPFQIALSVYVFLWTAIGIIPTIVLVALAADKWFPGFFFAFFPLLGFAWLQIGIVALIIAIAIVFFVGYYILGCFCGICRGSPLDACFRVISGEDD
jgi:hypothetical protein